MNSKFFHLSFIIFVSLFLSVHFIFAADGPITRTLKLGMRDIEIKYLQQFLNENGFNIAASGPGSRGNETSYFGILTLRAVKKYQSSFNLISDGVFGPASVRFLFLNNNVYLPGCFSKQGYSALTGKKCSGESVAIKLNF